MQHKKSYRSTIIWIFAAIVILAVVMIAVRIHESSKLKSETKKSSVPVVSVIQAKPGPSVEEVVLPGNVQAWHEAPVYARTNGYLKDWKTDIGTPVKEGDLLAEIETPEVDSQLRQAEADLATAQANASLAQSTAVRWKALLKTDSVSKQETDEKVGNAAAQQAALNSARANRDRLRDMESFKRVVAPFDGIITARNTDTGALIANGNSATELFHIADTSKLRIYVSVPQTQAAALSPNMPAELHFAEHPGKTYMAQLFKTADAIDPASRTLLAQFTIDNANNALLAGGYTEVHLKVPGTANQLRLPVNTLIFRAAGLQVATLDSEHHVALKTVTMGRDFGNDVEVIAGLEAGETVIVNPPDSIADGDKVRVKKPKEAGDDKDKASGDKSAKDGDKDKKTDASDKAKSDKQEEKADKESGIVAKGDDKNKDKKSDSKSSDKDVDADSDDDDDETKKGAK